MLLSRQGVEETDLAGRSLARYLRSVIENRPEDLSSFLRTSASDLRDLRKGSRPGCVDLLPSLPGLRFEELAFDRREYRRGPEDVDPAVALANAFKRDLDWARRTYDVVLMDCPPGFSTLSRAGVLLADVIISPTIADAISVRALKDFVDVGLIEHLRLGSVPHYVVISKFIHNREADDQRTLLRRTYRVLEPSVPHKVDFVRAASPRRPNQVRGLAEKWRSTTGFVKLLADSAHKVIFAR